MVAAITQDLARPTEFRRSLLCRMVFAFILIFLSYYGLSNTLVHQLQKPVLVFPYVDATYLFFHVLGIPAFVTGNILVAWIFDMLLFASCILSFLFPNKRLFIACFFVLYFIYYLVFNSYGTQHTHSKVGILLMPLPFLFTHTRFLFLWEGMRYFKLFVYADAFIWKLLRFNFLSPDHGSLVIKKNFAAYIYFHPQSLLTDLYSWLLLHQTIVQVMFISGVILEGCFIIGFFTKRFDRVLFILSVILPFGFMLLSDAFFFEMLVLSFTLMKFKSINQRVVP